VDLIDYRRATWASVGMLWKPFDPDPETTITRMFPQAGPFVDQMCDQKETVESAALQIVTNVLVGYIHHGMPVEQRRAVLLELHRLTKLGLEQAEGYPALPFVAHTVAGWFVVQDWAGNGKITSAQPFLQDIIGALAASLQSPPST
jgi:hypothetical protein